MSEATAPPELVDYPGNCHCGAFKFTLKAPKLTQAFTCNCSICSKNGYMWAFPANVEHFTVVQGEEIGTLKSYEFGKRTMAHKFCPTCGTSVMTRMHNAPEGHSGIAINIRALADVDLSSFQILGCDGAAAEPHYQVPENLPAGPVADGTVVYNGNCHCGAIAYTLRSPERISTATDCNCSICSREAALWTYPETSTVSYKNLEALVEYTFGKKTTLHGFCGICGVAIRERFVGAGRDTRMALNARTMNGVELATLEAKMNNGKADLPLYQI
ncbi:Mss4-like protein [Mycena latifolia]|nr:Mss4-like protein [Mycena latifolia]